MARLELSALANGLYGSLGGSTGSKWKGIQVLKKKVFRPRQPRTAAQQAMRGLIGDLAGDYYGLTSQQKTMWEKYASMSKGAQSGINAYVALNSKILKYVLAAAKIVVPPATPSTPDRLVGHTLTDAAGTSTLTWSEPTSSSFFIGLDFSYLAGLDDTSHPRWSHVGVTTADSADLVHTHGVPTGVILNYRSWVADEYGRISPPSETMTIEATVA